MIIFIDLLNFINLFIFCLVNNFIKNFKLNIMFLWCVINYLLQDEFF